MRVVMKLSKFGQVRNVLVKFDNGLVDLELILYHRGKTRGKTYKRGGVRQGVRHHAHGGVRHCSFAFKSFIISIFSMFGRRGKTRENTRGKTRGKTSLCVWGKTGGKTKGPKTGGKTGGKTCQNRGGVRHAAF